MKQRILIWDSPTRIFHWSFALTFAGAYLTAESERLRYVHVMLGYTMLGLIAFRLLWGFIGSRYARFVEFVRGPREVFRYLYCLIKRRPTHYLGHNPAGAVAILLLIALGAISCLSGWLLYEEVGGEWFEEIHEVAANAMLALAGVHVLAVIVSSRIHGENLALAMITGYKMGRRSGSIPDKRSIAGVLLLFALVGIWVWGLRSGQVDKPSSYSVAGLTVSSEDEDEERD